MDHRIVSYVLGFRGEEAVKEETVREKAVQEEVVQEEAVQELTKGRPL
jgi:hypothetical protein